MANLELLNRAHGDVLRRGPYVFIADVHAIHFKPRRTTGATTDRYRRETVLCGVESLTILNLHAGFELRQIKKVAANGKLVNLLCCHYTLYRRLFGADTQCRGLNFNYLAFPPDFESHVAGRDRRNLDRQRKFAGSKALGFHAHHVFSGSKSTRSISAGGGSAGSDDLSRRFIGDRDPGAAHNCPTGIGHCAQNRPRGNGRLSLNEYRRCEKNHDCE